MRKRVPLNAIRAFEAVARHASVAKAAEELCVTPTAVSHQIKLLEDFLQTELFLRRNSRIYLTSESSATLSKISQALDLIDDSVRTLGGTQENLHARLTVGASTSFASFWLMPRLRKFIESVPEIDLCLHTFISRKEAETQDSDLRICNWQSHLDWKIEPLMEEENLPVCTPELARRHGNDPAKLLANAPLIHVDRSHLGYEGNYPDWSRYLEEYGIQRPDVMNGPRFNQAGTAIEAARAGVGLLLGRSLLVEQFIDNGELVMAAECYPERSPYYLLSSWKTTQNDAMRQFRDWIVEAVSSSRMVHAL
ncbi:LysR substrate-binding domain-containing protein [Thioclava kandeliae]|uniref:LysR substrate-binding domain-containing protein n=1 Tax=Thioclava kandeliae TaxID=3070818 RepID=A0ABV1SEM9_9RHOB